jgi:hypothetical protein
MSERSILYFKPALRLGAFLARLADSGDIVTGPKSAPNGHPDQLNC